MEIYDYLSGGKITLDASMCDGKTLYPQEATICVGGVAMTTYVLMSDPG
jgi:hypothetical protein